MIHAGKAVAQLITRNTMAGDEETIRQLDMGYRLNVSRDLISACKSSYGEAGRRGTKVLLRAALSWIRVAANNEPPLTTGRTDRENQMEITQAEAANKLKVSGLYPGIASDAPPSPVLRTPRDHIAPQRVVGRPRLDSVDLLRGVVMVVMALDHTRDFFGGSVMNPRDVNDPALFMTRWVTHFCAPVFIFLAGMSAFLYGSRGRSKLELSRFLLARGAWLVVIELTVVLFGWTFDPAINFFVLQVIWAIGWSMIALAGLVHLPHAAVAALALAMIAGHNLLDGIEANQFQDFRWVWLLLHEPGLMNPVPGVEVLAVYPLIPWIGVMAAGYAFGPVITFPEQQRRRWLLSSGFLLLGIFIGLRAANVYGDPAPWLAQESWGASLLSFINCEKYPPSLLYLAMTLGPALIALVVFERPRGKVLQWLITFWTGTVLLLYRAHLSYPSPGGGRRGGHGWRPRMAVPGYVGDEQTRRLWGESASRLRALARDCAVSVSALPLVCHAEAVPERLVAQLPLSGCRQSFRGLFGASD